MSDHELGSVSSLQSVASSSSSSIIGGGPINANVVATNGVTGDVGAIGAIGGQGPAGRRSSSSKDAAGNPYDINATTFNPDFFIKKIIKEYSLNKLMETESNLIRQIQDLDSDMQTLVYENYNKFIDATDTIRKMKTDFGKMEDKMGLLSTNIGLIAENSACVSNNLKDKRDKVSRLSAIHDLLKKLKFLFELPNKLKQFCEEKNHEDAVKCYLDGVEFVSEFKRFPSLEAIKVDCQQIVETIRADLYQDFDESEKSSQDLIRNVPLLLSLGELPSVLGQRFLENAKPKLNQNLDSLKMANNPNVSLEEFMELGCGIFVSNLSLVIASFSQAFIQTADLDESVRLESQDALKSFSQGLMSNFLELMENRLLPEVESMNSQDIEQREELIKALERLYRRLISLGILVPNADFAPLGLNLIHKVAKLDSELSLQRIKSSFEKAVKDSSLELRSHPGSSQEILGSILATLVLQMKSSLTKLQDFCRPDLQFAQHLQFRQKMSIVCVREGLVVASFKYLAEFGRSLLLVANNVYDILTWLLLAKLYLDIENGTVDYMVNSVELEFDIKRDKRTITKWDLTNVSDITSSLNITAKLLVKEFVSVQGNDLAEIIKSAILDKSLMSMSKDPTGPQPELKRVVEKLTKLEKLVDSIFPDPDANLYLRSERSSDSSRRSYSTNQGNKGPSRQSLWSNLDTNMTTNIQKLFSEKVEIFGTVELQKSDIMMAVVKICLRALLEFVRQKTMSKFGLHQIQVDVHYFQLYLWRFVNNESYLYSLLDEILASSIHRCTNPTLLEASVVESLAEK